MSNSQLILSAEQSKKKIERLAFEIFEQNFEEKELIIAGIFDKGYVLAKALVAHLQNFDNKLKISLVKVSLDKFSPTQSDIELDISYDKIKNKSIILVDDVLNSGRTLAYSLRPFLKSEIKKIQIAVLVDRGHKSFPVSADFVGYSLSTTLKEHIEVQIKDEIIAEVYLK